MFSVMLDISDIAEAERAAAHLIPKYPGGHDAGLIGIGAGLVVIGLYWLVAQLGSPLLALLLGLVAAYGIGRQHSNAVWKPYHELYRRILKQKIDSDA